MFLTGKGPKPGSRKFSFTKSKGIGQKCREDERIREKEE
jgi:hypothetical protein